MTNATPKKSHTKVITIVLCVFAVVAAAVIYFGIITKLPQPATSEKAKIAGLVLPTATEIMDFQLTDQTGKSFSNADLKGHWTMMFFGFTNCGMVCPTTMAALNDMYKTLQRQLPNAKLPSVVMVSVDPERDTVERMNEYVSAFNSHFLGARAEMPQIQALEKELHLVSVKMQPEGAEKNQYTINHSAEIIVLNPEGKVQAFMSYPHKAEQMVADYKTILSMQVS